MTTTVVAYTSLRAGHVTRFISLRTSVRKVRPLFHHPVMPLPSLPPAGLTCSIVAMFPASLSGLGIRDLGLESLPTPTYGPPSPWLAGLPSVARRHLSIRRAKDGRSGGTRTPSPRFWRPMLYQLSY